ncbi:hypothetical protein BpHYR1_053264 [Brachionus plicatilis]|uniref:Uncharacterized protein n=1 Tax=Brachionus plicatilis TaxID=10195 RepID=A0A3M7T1G7_BRAPC|nr:hypothetical protein BpHYR1_053264 [Brachionus plicatilis]
MQTIENMNAAQLIDSMFWKSLNHFEFNGSQSLENHFPAFFALPLLVFFSNFNFCVEKKSFCAQRFKIVLNKLHQNLINTLISFSLILDEAKNSAFLQSTITINKGCLRENENGLILEKILNKLSISSLKWDLKLKTLCNLYKSLIGSILDYSFPFLN